MREKQLPRLFERWKQIHREWWWVKDILSSASAVIVLVVVSMTKLTTSLAPEHQWIKVVVVWALICVALLFLLRFTRKAWLRMVNQYAMRRIVSQYIERGEENPHGVDTVAEYLDQHLTHLLGTGDIISKDSWDKLLTTSLGHCDSYFFTSLLSPSILLDPAREYLGDFLRYLRDQVRARNQIQTMSGNPSWQPTRVFIFAKCSDYDEEVNASKTLPAESRRLLAKELRDFAEDLKGLSEDQSKKIREQYREDFPEQVNYWKEMVRLHNLIGFQIGYLVIEKAIKEAGGTNEKPDIALSIAAEFYRDMGYFRSGSSACVIDAGSLGATNRRDAVRVACVIGKRAKREYTTRLGLIVRRSTPVNAEGTELVYGAHGNYRQVPFG